MNEGLLDEHIGREHVRELLKEAEQERLAQKAARNQRGYLTRLRVNLIKALSVIIS